MTLHKLRTSASAVRGFFKLLQGGTPLNDEILKSINSAIESIFEYIQEEEKKHQQQKLESNKQ